MEHMDIISSYTFPEVNGQLQELDSRGTGAIGMLAWRLLLRTPEFPEGRSVVLIANDVTHQAGWG